MLDVYVKRRNRFSLRDKRLFEIIEVEITRVDCLHLFCMFGPNQSLKSFSFLTYETEFVLSLAVLENSVFIHGLRQLTQELKVTSVVLRAKNSERRSELVIIQRLL